MKDLVKVLEGRREINIAVYGRKSGRLIELPVWFVLEKNRLLLLPVYGSRTSWYRNLKANPKIRVKVGDFDEEFTAKLLESESQVKYVVRKFEEKYGKEEIKKWYSGFDAAVEISLE